MDSRRQHRTSARGEANRQLRWDLVGMLLASAFVHTGIENSR